MFFRISVIDSEQETIYSVEDDPFDCGMRSSSEAESDYHNHVLATYRQSLVPVRICMIEDVCDVDIQLRCL